MKKILIFIPLVFILIQSRSQAILTPEEAVSIALKGNYGIQVARNEQEINRINNSPGNAGMLPTLGVSATDNYSFLTDSYQKYATEETTSQFNGTSNSLNAGIDLGWTLFDGGRMFIARNRLREVEAAGEYRYQDQVFQTVYDVITAYYNVVRQKQQLRSYQEVINFNQERVRILEISLNAGLKPKTDLLQAKIDLNVVREQAIVQEAVIIAAKRSLNQFLSRDPEIPFEVGDTIIDDFTPDDEVMVRDLYAKNTGILWLEKELDIAGLLVREEKAARLPRIDLDAGYRILINENNTTNVRTSRVFGPQIGGTLSFPVWQGGDIRRSIAIARLNESTARLDLEARKIETSRQLRDALTSFRTQKQLLDLEKENHGLARENLYISMERLRLGQTTSLEVRQAQQSFSESMTRLINLQYNLKVAETRLRQLMADFQL